MKRLMVTMIVAISLFASPMSTTAAGDAFQRSPHEWPLKLSNAREYILNGKELPSGFCRYEFPDARVATPDIWFYTRVIGVDPEGCRLLLEDGTSTVAPEPPSGQGYAYSTASAAAIADASPLGPEPLRMQAIHTVQWVDPIRLAVNWVRNTTTWNYNGICASQGSSAGAFDWLWLTGWYRTAWTVSQSRDGYCKWWQGQSTATYRNDTFCGLNTTWAHYDYVRVRGWYDGAATFSRSTYVAGACYDMLDVEWSSSVKAL